MIAKAIRLPPQRGRHEKMGPRYGDKQEMNMVNETDKKHTWTNMKKSERLTKRRERERERISIYDRVYQQAGLAGVE